MTWVLIMLIAGWGFQVEGYSSEQACEAARAVAIKKFRTEWKTAFGECIPGRYRGD